MTNPAAPFALTLTDYAYGGEAFGRDSEGRVVFVPYGIAGERVRVEPVEVHKRWARARLLAVEAPSAQRVEPRCRHYQTCGGCHYQHMSYPAQLLAKAQVVRDQLIRLGRLVDPPVWPTLPSPDPWNYRARLSLHLAPDGRPGFVTADSRSVFALEECHLASQEVDRLWRGLDVAALAGVERIEVQDDGVGHSMIVFHAEEPPAQEMEIGLPASVIWVTEGGRWVLAGGDPLQYTILGRTFQVSAGSFFQVNPSATPGLVNEVLEALHPEPGETVFDLYAGVGLFSAFAAERGAAIVAVEASAAACLDFEVNLESFDAVELYEAPVELALPAIPDRPHAIVADPPRAAWVRK